MSANPYDVPPAPKWAEELVRAEAHSLPPADFGSTAAIRKAAHLVVEVRRKALEEAALACEAIEAAVEDLPEPDGPATYQLCRDLEAQTAAQCASDIRALGGLPVKAATP
jgi:hypothetical protein